MPLTVVNKKIEIVEETKMRGLLQITRTGDAWECRAVVYNSRFGSSTVALNDQKVIELFKAIGCPLPIERSESHIVEFLDGPEAAVWASFGFDAANFPAAVAEVV